MNRYRCTRHTLNGHELVNITLPKTNVHLMQLTRRPCVVSIYMLVVSLELTGVLLVHIRGVESARDAFLYASPNQANEDSHLVLLP